ncbi:MAG: hypothetical protein HQK61_05900 [Desulfamplus sp.]|nr:hypothetical protein [Desulfamplus sp.]
MKGTSGYKRTLDLLPDLLFIQYNQGVKSSFAGSLLSLSCYPENSDSDKRSCLDGHK